MKHSVAETVKLCWLVLKRNEQWVCKDLRLKIVRSLKKEMYNELFEVVPTPVPGSWEWWGRATETHINQRFLLNRVHKELKYKVERWRPYYRLTNVKRLRLLRVRGSEWSGNLVWEWVGFPRQ